MNVGFFNIYTSNCFPDIYSECTEGVDGKREARWWLGGGIGCFKLQWEPIQCSENSWDIKLPFSPILPLLFFLSLSHFFTSCLSLRSHYTSLKGLLDSYELQCPTWSMLQRLSLGLGGACCLNASAADQLFCTLISLFLCNCVCVQERMLNTDLMSATPTREFLTGSDRERMSQHTNISVQKLVSHKAAGLTAKLHSLEFWLNSNLIQMEQRFCWIRTKRKIPYRLVVEPQLVFLTSAHCVLQLHCVCTSVLDQKLYQTFQCRPANKFLSRE